MWLSFWKLVQYEFRRFKGRSKLALIFVFIIPLLYGGIYLHANWNLYDHIGSIKIAVTNHDAGATLDKKDIHGGELFENALRHDPTFDWQFLGTDDQRALDGLARGEYFMIINVPADFSQRLVSAASFQPARAQLELHRDDANGFIIGTLTGKAEDALAKSLDAGVSQAYFKALFADLEKIRENLVKASEGSAMLDQNLAKAKDGVHELDQGVLAIGQKSGTMDQISASLDAGFKNAEEAADEMTKVAEDIRRGTATLEAAGAEAAAEVQAVKNAAQPLAHWAATDLPDLKDKSGNLATVTARLTNGPGPTLVTISRHQELAVKSTTALTKAHPELANDPDFTALVTELNASRNETTTVSGSVDLVTTLSIGLNTSIANTGLPQAAQSLDNAIARSAERKTKVDEGVAQIHAGIKGSDAALGKAKESARSLVSAGRTAQDVIPKVASGAMQLTNALGQLDTAMPLLSDGAHQLSSGLKDGARQLPQLTESQRNDLAQAMSSPVDVTQTVDHSAHFYGRGLAPMFFSIALWISCVSTFLVVRTISGRALTGRASTARISLLGFGPLAIIGVIGALIMGLGVWFVLGLDPVHPGLFILLLVVASLSFMALAHWIRLIMGSPQTAIFLVWLILQLPACGGTFPVAMLDPFYQNLAVVSPMKYTVDAFRVVISGGSMSLYWSSMAVLTGILAVSGGLIYALVHRRKCFRIRDLHPPMITSRSTADYAFSVRPR